MTTPASVPTKSFLLELRDAAKDCPNVLTRKLLRDAADDLDRAIAALNDNPTVENMQTLNGKWVLAVRVLKTATVTPPPSGTSGAGEPDKVLLAA